MKATFQIDDSLGTYQQVADATAHADIMGTVRRVVSEAHPGATEKASSRERSVWWGWGPAKMKQGYAYVMPHKDYINLGFFHGVDLPDPEGLLEGTGKKLRHIKLHTTDTAASPPVRRLIEAARDERRQALGL